MDGRDIGTVVFPNADMKLFMTASVEARALRRYQELLAKGETVSFDEIRNNLQNRDHIDSSREESPLRKAADAISLDNSGLTHDQQMKWVTDKLKQLFPDIEINPS